MAIHFAKAAAANAVIDGWKTVEMCQAFALWSVYNPPARRWEEDRAWCYTGIAFRYVAPRGPIAPARPCVFPASNTLMSWLPLLLSFFLRGLLRAHVCVGWPPCSARRLATELNLSRIPDKFADERQERESHNRTRMWLMCFIMDRCLSIQSGKAWMVQEDAVGVYCGAVVAGRD